MASGPVPNTSPLSGTSAIVEILHDPLFNLSSAGGRRPVDDQINVLLIGPLRRLAACFGMPPNPTTSRFQLGKYAQQLLYGNTQVGPSIFSPAFAAGNMPASSVRGDEEWCIDNPNLRKT